MEIKGSQKMSIFTDAIFGDLKRAALEKEKQGYKIIDLSLGSPDISPDVRIREKLAEKSLKENMYGYTLNGLDRFNKAVSRYYERRSNVFLDPEREVLQTMGSQEGLVHLPLAFCNKGDIVLTTNPAYVAYDAGIKLAGATPYYMPLYEEKKFLPDLNQIPVDVAEKASLLILNLPGNPVPATPSHSFFEEVVSFAKKYNIIVLHDAAYSEFYFTGDKPISFLSTPEAKDVGVEINSLSKSFSLAGARVAYIVGNEKVIQIMKKFKSNLDYGIFQPIQEAAIVALNNAEEITEKMRTVFRERHNVLKNGLQNIGWEVTQSSGGMFIWANYPYDIDAQTFAFQLIEQTGVVTVPGSAFGSVGEGYVRIALVQDVEVIKEAVKYLSEF